MEVRNLCFKYEDRNILDGISFGIKPGSFVSIIGPNGSGKTTLLKNMSSVLTPQGGSILLGGKDIRKYRRKELARCMAYVPQSTPMDFGFTVMDVVLMGRSPYISSFKSETLEDIRIAEDAMRMTNMMEFRDKKISQISGGEKQRAIIACALAQTPEIIMLDEPVSSLDIQHQIEVLGILKRLNREKKMTVITVLHDLNLASEYSDILMLLMDGKLMDSGSPARVITGENIRKAYNTDIYMTQNPLTGNPHIIPVYKA
jgi:iron complex transport system ATP-binding protein